MLGPMWEHFCSLLGRVVSTVPLTQWGRKGTPAPLRPHGVWAGGWQVHTPLTQTTTEISPGSLTPFSFASVFSFGEAMHPTVLGAYSGLCAQRSLLLVLLGVSWSDLIGCVPRKHLPPPVLSPSSPSPFP